MARKVAPLDAEIDQKERNIESMCLKMLLQQQPVARDLRQISAALKMITDMERIGDQAEDIAEIVCFLNGRGSEDDELMAEMAAAAIKMVTESVDAYVKHDILLAEKVVGDDDTVDRLLRSGEEQADRKDRAGSRRRRVRAGSVDDRQVSGAYRRPRGEYCAVGDLLRHGDPQGGLNMIWCVEDDASIRDIEVYALRSTGMEARGFEDGTSFWEALQQEKPTLVILDVMLPGIDGVELLRRMREDPNLEDIPVVMATAKDSEIDKIQGLDLGADYYLTKPFGVMELVSCVKAVLRRCEPRQAEKLLRSGGLVMNLDQHKVTVDGKPAALTYKEFELLRLFLQNPGIAFTRDQLFDKVWGQDFYGETRTIDTHILTLRQKLGPYGGMIQTVRNVGYRLEEPKYE